MPEPTDIEISQEISAGRPDPRCVTRKQLAGVVLILMIVSFSLAGLGIALNRAAVRESERKFCEATALSVQNAHRRVDAFKTEPPITEAGRVQAQEAVIGLSAVENLERRLGCPAPQE